MNFNSQLQIVVSKLTQLVKLSYTRMHSSRMRTVRCRSRPGGVSTRHPPEEAPPGGSTPQEEAPPLEEAPPGGSTPLPHVRKHPPYEQNEKQV